MQHSDDAKHSTTEFASHHNATGCNLPPIRGRDQTPDRAATKRKKTKRTLSRTMTEWRQMCDKLPETRKKLTDYVIVYQYDDEAENANEGKNSSRTASRSVLIDDDQQSTCGCCCKRNKDTILELEKKQVIHCLCFISILHNTV